MKLLSVDEVIVSSLHEVHAYKLDGKLLRTFTINKEEDNIIKCMTVGLIDKVLAIG